MPRPKKIHYPVQLMLRLPERLKRAIETTAERRGISAAELTRNALREKFMPADDMEPAQK